MHRIACYKLILWEAAGNHVRFNNNDNSNLNLANLNFATAGQPLKTSQLTNTNFGVANIKYGARLIELGAKFTF